jgi:PIN domain nuclease of toxin-antitoxin system
VSFWEITIKAALRCKDFRVDTDALIRAADAAGLNHLPFVAAHAVHVAQLPRHHPDPFDRALIAQAALEPLTLLTHDAPLARYGSTVRVI